MQIERLRLKNFRAFRDVEMRDIPRLVVLVGANGVGKSTLFSVFGFLRDAMTSNVTVALANLGGSRGFQEVRSREATGPIEIELQFREKPRAPLVTYLLSVDENPDTGRPFVAKEQLQYRRGNKDRPWYFLNFAEGKGEAVTNEIENVKNESDLVREPQSLKAPDLLAIKGLAQFERFPAAVALGNLIERWHISDFHISRAKPEQETGYVEHLFCEGENLSLVVEYLHKHHPKIWDAIKAKLAMRVPGITSVESKQTEEGRILLKFQDGSFKDPFRARCVPRGTIKMLAYLVLLYAPDPHPLLCVEAPENQLYHSLLMEVAEEFRAYSCRGSQVFISTHSPDFLNAMELDEVFWLQKTDGFTSVFRARDDTQLAAYMREGDQMGYLWKQGFFPSVALV